MSWYGSVKHARKMGEEEKPKRVVQAPSLSEQSNAIEVEIEALKNQIKEKKRALKQLHQEEDAKKQIQLTAAIAASGRSVDELIQMLSV